MVWPHKKLEAADVFRSGDKKTELSRPSFHCRLYDWFDFSQIIVGFDGKRIPLIFVIVSGNQDVLAAWLKIRKDTIIDF